jgi:exodeoxyribonuclease VIII
MIDLETLGNKPGCAIISIGAVYFDPLAKHTDLHAFGDEFYRVVQIEGQEEIGLHIDQNTVKWWEKQAPEARKVLSHCGFEGPKLAASVPIKEALNQLEVFLSKPGLANVRVWGNGSDFDNAILAVAYMADKRELPWSFWNNRCFRTLKALTPDLKLVREGVYHNALSDAKTQAVHALKIFEKLRRVV